MTQAKTRFTTLEEYAALDTSDLPEGNYELVNGVIIEMGAEADQNVVIAGLLFSVFLQFVPYYLIRRGTEIAVPSQSATSRYPDLMVLTEATRAAMRRDKRSLITPEMPVPCLVVEVISPGKPGSDNYDRDYIEKPREYAQRGIPEFWQIDPERSVVSVLTLEDGSYKARAFRGGDRIESEQFKQLDLTAQQILSAGM
ncbi:Uma2 family endonuclease [Microcoleus sp. FACHB-1515]|uniref:Uma2 family endonuclease n=1 Tax=Cyanophyceae TaxID=3028117 RepID=UPI001686E58D|nr:Uma2 family endonuclease [Microcoleus sp. FACHB-1515]MBD2088336.1 Uma2 family endonuclease [Microcoleus sp. FACHB-1515]